ncbi:hypothetical protein H4219_000918 [Mycoemilia scoparia]|uniref:Mannose-P-dolichol utilization defect 1 protein homolog n=1 Tax=Mycoemilia scoparia TaxID=417184 RepID=A0A9W8DW63_9FUNG|nr:hypothetical protein H4219_001356 [Mycoemilia scoparia]KAJ1921060.1 hypothetical protein H4219_000918 [Mycoemilia scoparia]
MSQDIGTWAPAIIREPVLLLLGKPCTVKLLDQLQITDGTCLKYAVSKVLGLGIVLGGCIVKLPQIYKIVKSRSAIGISLLAYIQETIANIITLAYNLREGNPFTTYGETLFIGIQNYLITIMLYMFSGRNFQAFVMAGVLLGFTFALFDSTWVSQSLLEKLQGATVAMILSSRASQIYNIWKNKRTGQLSAFTVFNYFFGTAARLYTTIMEVDDNLMLACFLLSTIANGILAFQMIWYWNADKTTKYKLASKKKQL